MGKSGRGEFDFISKRFKTLYKNVEMSRKALNGFINLTEDQQIKAEETIHHRITSYNVCYTKLLRLKIEEGDPGKVIARPAMGKDDKDLVWVGQGAHVSWETAQAMGRILGTGTLVQDSSLMARTQKLFRRELSYFENRVKLANGIEVA